MFFTPVCRADILKVDAIVSSTVRASSVFKNCPKKILYLDRRDDALGG